LSAEDRRGLEARARTYTSPYRDVIRAKIVLMAAQDLSNDVIGTRLDIPRQIVSKWRRRFHDHGFPGLEEQARGGAPVRFSPQRRR
jgi:transposase